MNNLTPTLSDATSTTGVRTLVVDDSPLMLKILAQILKEAGDFPLIATATDGRQALRYVSALSPELVLMDFHMLHFNGIDATRCIKARECSPVVIIISSDDSALAKAAAAKAGADGFIVKAGDLRSRLTRTLQGFFTPSRVKRAAPRGIPRQTPNGRQPNQGSLT